jgi:D-psicose/D-tagatose/L-ribulose 3-epimerase
MRLAMSNIGWEQHDDPQVWALLRAHRFTGIEVAPTKVWPDWQGADAKSAAAYRSRLANEGFVVPALQAILFGRPDLNLFETSSTGRAAWGEHIARVADLAQALGAQVLVYGAPKSRQRGSLSQENANEYAVELLRQLGELCAERATCLCIEPNPSEYGCDFASSAREALALVEQVDSAGFALHLDAAAMFMAHDPVAELLPRALPRVRHYHISEPYLSGFEEAQVPHFEWLTLLQDHGYAGFVSVEVDAKKHRLAHTLAFASGLLGRLG